MTFGHKRSWIHMGLLLGSLAAGVATTRLMPAYQRFIGKVTYPSKTASASEAPSDSSPGFSKTDVEERLTFARNVE